MGTQANTGERGMARYLTDKPAHKDRAIVDRLAAERVQTPLVTSIGTSASNAHTKMLRDPVARAAHREAEKAARREAEADRGKARIERANQPKVPTVVADPSARGMRRYLPRNDAR